MAARHILIAAMTASSPASARRIVHRAAPSTVQNDTSRGSSITDLSGPPLTFGLRSLSNAIPRWMGWRLLIATRSRAKASMAAGSANGRAADAAGAFDLPANASRNTGSCSSGNSNSSRNSRMFNRLVPSTVSGSSWPAREGTLCFTATRMRGYATVVALRLPGLPLISLHRSRVGRCRVWSN
jgi:hypothetical protein